MNESATWSMCLVLEPGDKFLLEMSMLKLNNASALLNIPANPVRVRESDIDISPLNASAYLNILTMNFADKKSHPEISEKNVFMEVKREVMCPHPRYSLNGHIHILV